MSRPLLFKVPGADCHVTYQGSRREPIWRDDEDRRAQIGTFAQTAERIEFQVLVYRPMGINIAFTSTTALH